MPIQLVDDGDDVRAASGVTGLLFGLPVPPPDYRQLRAGVSLCMIVKNEEQFLEGCLRSVRGAVDEMCIFDTGSTDRTIEIALAHGARVQRGTWRSDFAWARNQALAMATRRWIVVLDADELITEESVPFLRALGSAPAHHDVVYVRIVNDIDDEAGAAQVSHALPRIFPNTPRLRFIGKIHESIALDGQLGTVKAVYAPIRLLHLGYTKAMVESRSKTDRNDPMIARDVEERPDESFSWYNAGGAAMMRRDWRAAIAAYEKLFEIEQNERSFMPLAWTNLALCWYNAERDGVRSIAVIDECLERVPTYAPAHFMRGDILSRLGRYPEARASFRRADEARRHSRTEFVQDETIFEWRADAYIAETYAKEGRHEAALEHLDAALVRRPEARGLRRAAATAAEHCGRYAEAEEHYRVLVTGGEAGDALRYVQFMAARGALARAARLYDETVAALGGSVDESIALPLAAAARAIGRPVEAELVLRAVLQHVPAHGPALGALEEVLRERGDTAALEQLRAAERAAEPRTADDWTRRAYRLLADGDPAGALQAAQRGLELRDDPATRYDAALAALRLGRNEVALDHLIRIPLGDTDVARAAVQLRVRLALDADEPDQALAVLDAFTELVPTADAATVERARILDQLGRGAEAEAALRARIGSREVAVELASRLLREGRLAEAATIAGTALGTSA